MTGSQHRVHLVLGGARSGKSVEAERLVTTLAGGSPVTYVATAVVPEPGSDPEMEDRIAAHRVRRPGHWSTVDAGADLAGLLGKITGPVLLDSLGPWVAAGWPEPPDYTALVDALRSRDGPTVVVSDEVGLAVHPPTEAGRWFVDAMGTLNQAVAADAHDVRLVVAGRVLHLPAATEGDL